MNWQNSRRRLLKLAGSLPASLPLMSLASESGGTGYSVHRLEKQVTADGVRSGTLVIVDTAVTKFDGDGYYLYPDWGNPVIYQVRTHKGRLSFYYPGTGKVLWKMAAGQGPPLFSGRVEGVVDSQDIAQYLAIENLPLLRVPAFPPVA